MIIKKSFKIIEKILFLIWHDGLFNTLNKSYQRYLEGGRKAVTKGINIRYKLVLNGDELLLYNKWISTFEENKTDSVELGYQPLISIIMPTYNTDKFLLSKAIGSVLKQNYTNWELCIADDASSSNETIKKLQEYEKKYDNIKVVYRQTNGHISRASNSALEIASGEYIALLDHDDMLAPFALYEVAKRLNENSKFKLLYSDEDKIDSQDKRFSPHFKSSWNPDMFFSQNYISHLTVIKKEIIDKTEQFRVGYEGAQDYDLLLQCLKFIRDDEIAHIPKILYHWRAIDGSTAQTSDAKTYTTDAGIKALTEFFKDDIGIHVAQGELTNTYKVTYPIIEKPLVSIIIPTKDNFQLLSTCISSILEKTDYLNYEIIIIDNQTTEMKALEYLNELREITNIRVIQYDYPFNYALMNNYAVTHANGEFIVFLNNDIEVITPTWLSEMLQHAQRKEIGIVGAKLYYPDMTIQHAGVILGIGGVAGHAHKYFEKEEYGYFSRLKIIQNYSALTAACVVMKKTIFEQVNGFDKNLKIAFNDIDLSLKVLERGYRNLWTPYAELIHYESKSRGLEDTPEKKKRFDKEIEFMQKKWSRELLADKCYNKNLTLEHENFSLKIGEKN